MYKNSNFFVFFHKSEFLDANYISKTGVSIYKFVCIPETNSNFEKNAIMGSREIKHDIKRGHF